MQMKATKNFLGLDPDQFSTGEGPIQYLKKKYLVYMVQIIKKYLNSAFTVQRTLYVNNKPILDFFCSLYQNASCI